jgi:multidrug efflux system membrane fusion protein
MNPQITPASEQQNYGPTKDAGNGQQHPSRRWIWVALALLLMGIVVWRIAARHSSAAQANQAKARGPMITPVTAVVAHKGDIGVYFTGLGAVTPLYTVTVRTRVDGQLMKVLYKEGQTVHKGDLLAVLDPRPFEVQLTQAQGQLIKDQASLENARVDLARYQELIKRNAVAEQTLATQRAAVVQDEGAVKTDQGQIASAKLNLIYCNVTAPITGRVGLRLVDPGNIVHATDTNGLLVITQIEPISVIFTISEDQVPPVLQRLRAGERLRVDAYNRDLKAKLSGGELMTLDNQIDQTTGTLRLRAIFSNKDDALFPNQFVNARLLVYEKRDVVLVPNAAIQRNSQATFVYVVKPDQTVTIRQITLGTTEADESEIVSGLAPGDVVVTTGVDKLQEGSKVNAQIAGGSNQRPGS